MTWTQVWPGFSGMGAAIALGDLFLLLLTALVVLSYLAYRAEVEEHILRRGLGDEYARYARRVPALLPWPRFDVPKARDLLYDALEGSRKISWGR